MDARAFDHWSLMALLRADLARHYEFMNGPEISAPTGLRLWYGMTAPRFVPILLCRLAHTLYRFNLNALAKIISLINFVAFGIEISVRCPIGPGLFLPHTQGTVIGAWRIGANATIFQGVTLGAKEIDFTITEMSRPTLGNGVTVGAGAKVLGGITLADDVKVGANSVVLSDIPQESLVVGVPARIVKKSKISTELEIND